MTPRRGVALLTATVLLVMISLVALEQTIVAKPRRLVVAAIRDRAELEAAANGGVEHARATLSHLLEVGAMQSVRDAARVVDAWSSADGMVLTSPPDGELQYRVTIADAGARLNINTATPEQIRSLFAAMRVDARRADRLAQAIADWRDPDQLRRVNGAEREDYLRAGRAILPDDGPFASVDMLRFVVGMTDSLYQLTAPYLTVTSSGRIDLNTASRPVLLTLPGMTEEAVTRLLRDRQQGRLITDLYRFSDELSPGARELLRTSLPALQASTVLTAREMRVISEAWRIASTSRVRIEAIISRDDEGRAIWQGVSP